MIRVCLNFGDFGSDHRIERNTLPVLSLRIHLRFSFEARRKISGIRECTCKMNVLT